MNPNEYNSIEAGRVRRTSKGYNAFIPAPLPPTLQYHSELVLALSRADAVLSELSGLARNLPNPHLLITPYVRREAVLSSRIEGTQSTLADLLLDEAVGRRSLTAETADVHEVSNYVTALDHGIARLASLPLSLRLVRELHEKLMLGVRGDYATPGEFRRSQNWIGPPGCTLATATYVPPPPHEMLTALDDWEKFLHVRDKLPDLVQCALLHEHFEAIHPFLDGNGRIGRLLITLFLIERGRLSQPLLYLSDYIESHREEYYRHLQRIRTHGEWAAWLHYFLTAVEESGKKALRQAGELMDLRETLRVQFPDRPRLVLLMDALFMNPYITIKHAAEVLGVSQPTAKRNLEMLMAAGVMEETTGKAWGKVYLARPILEAIER
ncbi:MAG TPA: Fic family protein [Gammaproteobacteria bacterium]|nr:Fic family protein [Gammaproteobacteria bacterium]